MVIIETQRNIKEVAASLMSPLTLISDSKQ